MSAAVDDWRTSPIWHAVNRLYINADDRWWRLTDLTTSEAREIHGECRAYARVLDLLEGNDE